MGAVLKKLNNKIMKKINNLLAALLLVGLWHAPVVSQIACNADLDVSLGADGTATIFLDALLAGTIDSATVYDIVLYDGDTNEVIDEGQTSVTMTCAELEQTLYFTVTNVSTTATCWGNIHLVDFAKPVPLCVTLASAVTTNGQVELYAKDFNIGSSDNCGISAYTFGEFAFDFGEEVIGGITINNSVSYLFDEAGPIAALSNATAQQIEDYDNGLSQLWHPVFQSSSMTFSSAAASNISASISFTDPSGNFDFCTISIALSGGGNSLPGDCADNIERQVNLWDCSVADISAAEVISPGLPYENGEISKNGISYSPVLENPSFGGAGVFPLYIRYTSEGDSYTCTVQVTVTDNVAPIAIADQEISLLLTPDGSGDYLATLLPETADDGSYDNCSSVTFSLSQTLFTQADIGENTIILTVTDASGNSNDVLTTVYVAIGDCNSPLATLVQWPLPTIYIDNSAQDGLETTPQVLIDDYGFTESQVMPVVDSTLCDAVFLGYNDQVFNLSTGWKLIRIWNAINWISSEVIEFSQVINNFPLDQALSCISISTVLVESGTSVQLYAEDFVIGYTGNPTELTLVITDPDGNIVTDNMITTSYEGIPLTYTVTHTVSGNNCWGTLTVVIGSGSSCTFDPAEDINWPLAMISLSDDTAVAEDLSPQMLVDTYGFTLANVQVSINDTDCEVGFTYDDIVIELGGAGSAYFKILRTWTVVEWNSGDAFSFVQMINNTVDPSIYICDTLSRLTPIGDCDSGHTDTDDVEWPEDIAVSDHRITPLQLVTISGIDSLDAQPSYYYEPDLYSATYVDILADLTSTQILLDRNWTVSRNDGNGLAWTYTQTVTVNFEDFENLVTVNTPQGYALPGVEINNTLSTGAQGSVVLPGQEVESLYKFDDFKAGVDLRDLVLMRLAILGHIELDENQLIAGDYNGDGTLSTLDMIQAAKILFGNEPDLGTEWLFVDETNQIAAGLRPKASYVGIKLCDIDDSYGSSTVTFQEEDQLSYTDLLINDGESYEVDIHLNKAVEMRGASIYYDVNTESIEILNVSSSSDAELTWYQDGDGNLSVLMVPLEDEALYIDSEEEAILTIEIEARANGILSENLAFSDSKESMYIDMAYDRITLGGSIEGVILDVFDDASNALSFVNVYPNPATEYVTFDVPAGLSTDVKITLLDYTGRVVSTSAGQQTVDVSNLSGGVYVYKLESSGLVFFQKLIIHRP